MYQTKKNKRCCTTRRRGVFDLSMSRRILIVLLLMLVSSCSAYSVQVMNHAENQQFKYDQTIKHYECSQNETFKIMTLKIAHGRKEAVNQL